MTKKLLTEFKKQIKEVLAENKNQCSICIQNIDTGLLAYTNLHGVKVSWDTIMVTLFVPGEATFQIPFIYIKEFHKHTDEQIEIFLEGRLLVSIRKIFKYGEKNGK